MVKIAPTGDNATLFFRYLYKNNRYTTQQFLEFIRISTYLALSIIEKNRFKTCNNGKLLIR